MVHGEALRDQVLHDNDSDILGVAGVTVETEELRQKCPEVLMQIFEVYLPTLPMDLKPVEVASLQDGPILLCLVTRSFHYRYC